MLVMGILNTTPDSFSDGGTFLATDDAVAHGRMMIAEGAAIIDVGGESTRPGAQAVSTAEELARVIDVVEALSETTMVSIDTRSETVARAAVAVGAGIINDVGAGLGHVAADLGVGWIAMHSPAPPTVMAEHCGYEDVVAEVTEALAGAAAEAARMGAPKVWIDPGIGFGKDLGGNLDLLAHLDHLVATGWPVALGTSRKSSLGVLSGRRPAGDPGRRQCHPAARRGQPSGWWSFDRRPCGGQPACRRSAGSIAGDSGVGGMRRDRSAASPRRGRHHGSADGRRGSPRSSAASGVSTTGGAPASQPIPKER